VPAGYYSGGQVNTDANLITGNIKSGVNIFGVSGNVIQSTGNATIANVLSGSTFSNATAAGLTGSMANKGVASFTPGAAAVPVPAGYYSGGQVNTDANLITGNIKSGVSIFGVSGSTSVVDTSAGTASASDIRAGKTAYVSGALVTGTSHISSIVCQAPNWSGANCDVCNTHFTGANCDVCPTHFTGANCDVCIARWTGANCNLCTNGWSGASCDVVHPVVNKTGQTSCWDIDGNSISCAGTGKDGEHKYGINPPLTPTDGTTGAYNTPALTNSPRFTDNGDGTVTDNQTSLIWLKNANCFGGKSWSDALNAANTLVGNNTQCSLNDGSTAGQWRLPNINELHSLGPTWPPGTPFTSVQGAGYRSSSTYDYDMSSAWDVNMAYGNVSHFSKDYIVYVWPVRSGQ
jgi:hypothetical protein